MCWNWSKMLVHIPCYNSSTKTWPDGLESVGILHVIICMHVLEIPVSHPMPGSCQLIMTADEKRDWLTTFGTIGCSVQTAFSTLRLPKWNLSNYWTQSTTFPQILSSMLVTGNRSSHKNRGRRRVSGDSGRWGVKRPPRGGEPRKLHFSGYLPRGRWGNQESMAGGRGREDGTAHEGYDLLGE